jgi:hypothetical protein
MFYSNVKKSDGKTKGGLHGCCSMQFCDDSEVGCELRLLPDLCSKSDWAGAGSLAVPPQNGVKSYVHVPYVDCYIYWRAAVLLLRVELVEISLMCPRPHHRSKPATPLEASQASGPATAQPPPSSTPRRRSHSLPD